MHLEVNDLHAYYGASHALQGISLKISPGEIVGLLGRNGMGKSTVMKSIMGLLKPQKGTIRFDGTDIAGWAPYKIANLGVGYVPDERRIFRNLTVEDNLMIGVKGGKIDKNNHEAWTVERVLAIFPSLKDRVKNKGFQLSGGEQQMVATGRALMGNPSLMLVDEPTEGLAPIMVQAARDVLSEINTQGVSILLVEHNLNVAMSLSHRVYLMGKGVMGFEGSIEELGANPAVREKYLEV